MQAICYGPGPSALLDTAWVETNDERRKRKLADLISRNGGIDAVALAAGLNRASLDQVLKGVLLPPKRGSTERSPRALGDSSARAIERAFHLERGWFDNDLEELDMTPKELQLLGYFRELDQALQALIIERVRETAEKKAALEEGLAKALGQGLRRDEPSSR